MGNRSRYAAVSAAAAAAALASARRRARLRRAAEGVRDAIMPTHVADAPVASDPPEDDAHAPGHRHLGRADRARGAEGRRRAWKGHAAGKGNRLGDR